MTSRRFALLVGVIALAGLALRVAYVLLVSRHLGFPASQSQAGLVRSLDEAYYANGAHSVAHGHWFHYAFLDPAIEHAEHPPLTSMVLAPVAYVTNSELAMRLFGAVGGSVTIVVIGYIGRLIGGVRVGLVAAGMAAIYPNLWVNDGLLLAETWAALATALTILATYRLLRSPTLVGAAIVGACCALAMLARSELVLLLPLVAPALLLSRATPLASRLRLTAVALLAAGIVVSPWVIYNLSRFQEPVLLSTSDGDVLAGANCDSTYYGPLIGLHNGLCASRDPNQADLSIAAKQKREIAFGYIHHHLSRLPVVLAARVGRAWSIYKPAQMADINQTEGRPTWVSYSGLAMYWPLVVLAGFGAVSLRRRTVALIPLLGPIVIVTINAMVFFGFVRHRIAAEDSLVLLGTVGVCALVDRRPRPRLSPEGRLQDDK